MYRVRWMVKRHMPDVLRIEEDCFAWDAWSEDMFSKWLREKHTIGLIAEDSNRQVIGFAVYTLHRESTDIVNLAVCPSVQGQGIGRAMTERIALRRVRLTAQVRETNMDALLFFKALGFEAVDLVRNFYLNTDEDSIVMEYRQPVAIDAVA